MPNHAEHLAQYKFKPGNPSGPGRPRKRPQSDANEELLRSLAPVAVRNALNQSGARLGPDSTWADAIAYSLGRQALRGNVLAAKELRESCEGKSVARFELSRADTRPAEFTVVYAPLLPQDAPNEVLEAETKIIDMLTAEDDEDESKQTFIPRTKKGRQLFNQRPQPIAR